MESTTASGWGSASRSAAGRNLPVRTRMPRMPMRLRAADVRLDVVADHDRLARRRLDLGERRLEVGGGRLPHDLGFDAGGVLEPGDEGSCVEQRPRGPSATTGSCAGRRASRRRGAPRTPG